LGDNWKAMAIGSDPRAARGRSRAPLHPSALPDRTPYRSACMHRVVVVAAQAAFHFLQHPPNADSAAGDAAQALETFLRDVRPRSALAAALRSGRNKSSDARDTLGAVGASVAGPSALAAALRGCAFAADGGPAAAAPRPNGN